MSRAVEQITDHNARALSRLATQYRDKPLIASLLSVFGTQIQQVEDMLFGVLTGYRLASAVGEQLDVIGRVVGQAREAADDAAFRIRIAARIRTNLSIGTPEDLYTIFGILLPAETLSIVPYYPAGFVMDALEPLDPDLVDLYRHFFDDAKGGGVLGQFTYVLSPRTSVFKFSSQIDVLEMSSDTGLADVAQTSGGHLAGVFQ